MVCTASSLLRRAIRLAVREAAASTAAAYAADLGVRRVARIVEDHLIDAGGVFGANELPIEG